MCTTAATSASIRDAAADSYRLGGIWYARRGYAPIVTDADDGRLHEIAAIVREAGHPAILAALEDGDMIYLGDVAAWVRRDDDADGSVRYRISTASGEVKRPARSRDWSPRLPKGQALYLLRGRYATRRAY